MKKLYQKDEIWFAVIWIIVYVVGSSFGDAFSEKLGVPKLLTCAVGLVLSVILFCFVKNNGLAGYYGLCRPTGKIVTAEVQTALGIGYGLWLLRQKK